MIDPLLFVRKTEDFRFNRLDTALQRAIEVEQRSAWKAVANVVSGSVEYDWTIIASLEHFYCSHEIFLSVFAH